MEVNRERRHYLAADDVDELARQNTQLMTELWIVKDRLALLEQLLADKGVLARGEVDDTQPDETLNAELDRERDRYIRRIVGLAPDERSVESLKALGES
jgi:hypothetical protein